MRSILPKLFRGAHWWLGRARSFLLLTWYRLQFPGLQVGRGVTLGCGVRINLLNEARMVIGDRVAIEPNCQLRSDGLLTIGSDCFIGQGSVIAAAEHIEIGRDALIAANVTIRDQDHGRGRPHRLEALVTSPVLIGRNVWIGAGAVILKGVAIGDHSIIGANAVVTSSIPSETVAVGIPARASS